jgi:hypothetical protein
LQSSDINKIKNDIKNHTQGNFNKGILW